MKSKNSKKKITASKRLERTSRQKSISLRSSQTSTSTLKNLNESSTPLVPQMIVASIDQQWVKHEDYVKALVELENRKMVGQAMYDYIVTNELQYQSITLMAILKNWKNI